MNFGDVIQGLKSGKWARRAGWNGKGMHIYLETGGSWTIPGGVFKGEKRVTDPYICMYTTKGTHQPGWLASQADMLSDDWEIIDPA